MNTEEQRLDIIHYCDVLLNGVLKPCVQTDSTAEGRMITQLKWLKERADNRDLPLPVDAKWLSTLSYVYTNSDIDHLASAPDRAKKEVKTPMSNLLWLTEDARLLLKPSFYPYVPSCIDALTRVLQTSPRPLVVHEQAAIEDLRKIKQGFLKGELVPPVGSSAAYPNYIDAKSSTEDIPKAKEYFFVVKDLIFNGVRPDSWLTPEDANRETAAL